MAAEEVEPSEFSYLDADAQRLGVTTAPPVSRVDVGGGMSALKWGSGTPTIALLHGAGLHAHSWDSTLLVLDKPALAIDLPGHGHSDWREDEDYTAPTIAKQLTEALAQRPEIRTLVGHSLGGLAGIDIASALPGQIERLALVDVTPGFRQRERNTVPINDFMTGPDSFDSRDEVIDRALSFGIGSSREDLMRGVFLNTKVRADGRVVFRHHLAQLSPAAHRRHDPELLWQPLAALKGKTLLIRGTRGILDDEHVEEFLRRVPRGSVVDLEAGHNVQRDAAAALAGAIASFVVM